ncbi:MAG: cyclic nucleotide-binding domain-containing protein [Proteobacteria bacterium]|nr:cyclic nucleotide-binding domain-containing protein [Pseudomonadota bacterium]
MKELHLLDNGDSFRKNTYRLIKESDFFTGFTEDEIDILARWTRAYSADTGCVVLNEGDKSNCLCIITRGTINIFKGMDHDEHLKIAEISTGESIGEMGIIDGEPFSASAIASEDSEVLLITKEDFEDIIAQHRDLGNKLLWKLARVLTERLRQTTKRLAALLTGKK